MAGSLDQGPSPPFYGLARRVASKDVNFTAAELCKRDAQLPLAARRRARRNSLHALKRDYRNDELFSELSFNCLLYLAEAKDHVKILAVAAC